jgi:hypothetical protein
MGIGETIVLSLFMVGFFSFIIAIIVCCSKQ